MLLYKRILILEDDLRTLSSLLKHLAELEDDQLYSLTLTILTDYKQVESLINGQKDIDFNLILLDCDCKLNGNFHILDVKRFGIDKIISISAVPEHNERMKKLGVKHIVEKNLQDRDTFSRQVIEEVRMRIR